jgi:flagellar protein FlbD
MVALTRLNGHRFLVNCDLIKYSDAAPDTVLALVTGEKLVVTESPEEVRERMLQYRAEVLRCAWPEAAAAMGATTAHAVAAASTLLEKSTQGGDTPRSS